MRLWIRRAARIAPGLLICAWMLTGCAADGIGALAAQEPLMQDFQIDGATRTSRTFEEETFDISGGWGSSPRTGFVTQQYEVTGDPITDAETDPRVTTLMAQVEQEALNAGWKTDHVWHDREGWRGVLERQNNDGKGYWLLTVSPSQQGFNVDISYRKESPNFEL